MFTQPIMEMEFSTTLICFLIPLFFFFTYKSISKQLFTNKSTENIPKSYPIIGCYLAMRANQHRNIQFFSDAILASPNATFLLHRPLGRRQIMTANRDNVQHILKTKFHVYQKGSGSRDVLVDFLGDGIFNTDGPSWKFQRQIASHEFNTRSLRKFVETVVDKELSDRLIPIFSDAAKNKTVLDLQDILQRFAFDNVCKIAFGYDPAYLLPSLPEAEFAVAFENVTRLITHRFVQIDPIVWKIKKYFNIGSEKKLRVAVSEVRDFAKQLVRERKRQLDEKQSLDSDDLLSRFLSSGHSDEDFVTDIVISFILAGRDTTSAALVWHFWLVFKHPEIETQILKEINEHSEGTAYEEVKDMVYIHASLSESMRLYPPVPIDGKQATEDDILPDGSVVKKGMRVAYHPYAMGRSESLWGKDWAEFRPDRFLERDTVSGKLNYMAKDPYMYTVFQAGPRICLGKEMAYLQMKRVVAGILKQFRVVPAEKDGADPVFISYLSSKMMGGFPVRIEERDQ